MTSLQVEHTDEGEWRLLSPLVYRSDIAGQIEVPQGYVTDFASVPRLPMVYLLAGDTAHEAAVIHDWLYALGTVARSVADDVFREAAAASGVAWWRRWMLWLGVRVGGSAAYMGAA
jgi:hypothetical protein